MGGKSAVYAKPVVAVSEFENKSAFSGPWKIGAGMTDLLVERLLATEEVVVLERRALDNVMEELNRQGKNLFRLEGRAPRGRLQNAQYLIRGSITDFTVTGDSSGWFGSGKTGVRGGRQEARVTLAITLTDVATGEILASVRAEETATAGFFGASVQYSGIAFGGDSFFRTPLGRATERALDEAVRKVLGAIPKRVWEPRVADVMDGQVIINGGRNVGLRAGMIFEVRGESREITDPVTGNVIDVVPGPSVGRIRITAVKELASQAELIDGLAERGNVLIVKEKGPK